MPAPILADVDPEEVSAAAVQAVVDHLHQTAMRLDPSLVMSIPEGTGGLGLRPTARALALYAQRGLPVWDWTDSGMAADGLLEVLAALYSRAAGDGLDVTAIDVVDDVDPSDALGLVLVGAAARIRLDQGAPVTARELGVLAGLGAAGVRVYMRSGELPTTDERPARVPAEAATRWLAARGVPGKAGRG